MRNIDEILAVDGIDVFFIGPSDLSQSMGFPGNPKAPPVAEAIEAALAKIVAAGRTPGMPATHDNACRGAGKGCRYIYTHLPRLLGIGRRGVPEAVARKLQSAPARHSRCLELWAPMYREPVYQATLTRHPAAPSNAGTA